MKIHFYFFGQNVCSVLLLRTDEFFQGDQIGHFLPIGLLLKAQFFLRRQSSPKIGDILGYFLQKANFYIFTRINSFKTWLVVVAMFRFQNLFNVDVFDFQIELWGGYFGIFRSATVLATFSKHLAIFFSNHPVTLIFFRREETKHLKCLSFGWKQKNWMRTGAIKLFTTVNWFCTVVSWSVCHFSP